MEFKKNQRSNLKFDLYSIEEGNSVIIFIVCGRIFYFRSRDNALVDLYILDDPTANREDGGSTTKVQFFKDTI